MGWGEGQYRGRLTREQASGVGGDVKKHDVATDQALLWVLKFGLSCF